MASFPISQKVNEVLGLILCYYMGHHAFIFFVAMSMHACASLTVHVMYMYMYLHLCAWDTTNQ